MSDLASGRLLIFDAFALDETDVEQSTSSRIIDTPVASDGDSELGLWQIDPGEVTDVEVDEVFLVLAGSGTVSFSDGSAISLGPGVMVRLHKGDRTTWVIQETLRKLYVAS